LLSEAVAIIKTECESLFESGYTREQVNAILSEHTVPQVNHWIDAQRERILRRFIHETREGHALN
jgi:hypothetical protein